MADGDASTTTAPPEDAGKTFTQDQVNDLIAREKGSIQRKYADYEDVKSKASKFDELEAATKSDIERVSGERDSFKTQADQAGAENLRLRVALEKGLPRQLIDRLQGGTKEEMESDADELLKLVGPASSGFDGGARGNADEPASMDAMIRRAAGRS